MNHRSIGQCWNDLRDFAKPVKAISLPQDVPSTSDRRLVKLENQVQRLMEAHLAPKQSVQVNKITSSCEICSDDTQYCMENPEQALLITHPSVLTKREASGILSSPSKTTLGDDEDIMFIEIIKKYDDSRKEELGENEKAAKWGLEVEYFETFPTRRELAYHKYLMCGPIPSLFLRNPIITKGCPSNLKIPCNIGHVHVETE
ncbi:hypothetical protein Tco_0694726 [Tanacetum coccineum]